MIVWINNWIYLPTNSIQNVDVIFTAGKHISPASQFFLSTNKLSLEET